MPDRQPPAAVLRQAVARLAPVLPVLTVAGFALVGNEHVPTTIDVVDNVATLGTVAGAKGYRVAYYPQFTGYVHIESAAMDSSGAYSWQLIAEQE